MQLLGAEHALTAADHVVPGAVALAQVLGRFNLHRVGRTLAKGLDQRVDIRPCRRLGKRGGVDGHVGARDVVHFDGQNRDTGTLVLEGEVYAFRTFAQRNVPHFRINHLQTNQC